MATTTAPNQNVIGLKRKNNGAARAACVESCAYRTLQNSNVKSPN